MKRQLLTAMAVVLSLCGYAQTKGTNALGLGLGIGISSSDTKNTTDMRDQKSTNFTLGYGHFIKDNTKLGISLWYHRNKTESNGYINTDKMDYLGAFVGYQKYYPLYKKLNAFATGSGGYTYYKQSTFTGIQNYKNETDEYSLGAAGGLALFFSKRFALETTLLNSNIS
ncbi:MAG: hypothetical protein EOO88_09960, partial [Pedobacter sp.]